MMASSDRLIQLSGVTKRYLQGGTTLCALDGVSLDVPRGQLCSIVGPSGSGKSTLLHLIGGLDVADGGDIVIGEHRLSAMSDDDLTLFRRRHVGFVFQLFNLLPTLTAAENVGLPLLLDGHPRAAVDARATELLARVGLADRSRRRPDELSGGEMQRVAIARALILEPLLLLADEPTGNLDSKTGEAILALFDDACRNRGQTIVMVTHDPQAARRGDRVIALRDGRIVSDDATT
jgi:putative ABC transport system ATP-binding protein